MIVLPAINVPEGDEEALIKQLRAITGHTERIHIDVADGTMTPNRSWQDPVRLKELAGAMKVQAHLMVADPERILDAWLTCADEIVVHLEPLVDPDSGAEPPAIRLAHMRERCLAQGAKLLVAGGPDCNDRTLLAHRAYADGFLVLAVTPGASGQALQEAALDTVRVIRDTFEDDIVWVDGGVNEQTIARVRAAGASGAVAASAVFNSDDPVHALAALQ